MSRSFAAGAKPATGLAMSALPPKRKPRNGRSPARVTLSPWSNIRRLTKGPRWHHRGGSYADTPTWCDRHFFSLLTIYAVLTLCCYGAPGSSGHPRPLCDNVSGGLEARSRSHVDIPTSSPVFPKFNGTVVQAALACGHTRSSSVCQTVTAHPSPRAVAVFLFQSGASVRIVVEAGRGLALSIMASRIAGGT